MKAEKKSARNLEHSRKAKVKPTAGRTQPIGVAPFKNPLVRLDSEFAKSLVGRTRAYWGIESGCGGKGRIMEADSCVALVEHDGEIEAAAWADCAIFPRPGDRCDPKRTLRIGDGPAAKVTGAEGHPIVRTPNDDIAVRLVHEHAKSLIGRRCSYISIKRDGDGGVGHIVGADSYVCVVQADDSGEVALCSWCDVGVLPCANEWDGTQEKKTQPDHGRSTTTAIRARSRSRSGPGRSPRSDANGKRLGTLKVGSTTAPGVARHSAIT